MELEMYQNPSGEFTPMEKQYQNYVNNHIAAVKRSFDERAPLLRRVLMMTDAEMSELIGRVADHDLSKFSVNEFPQYRMYFYPDEHESKADANFAEAWEHHYTHNDHHPEYWIKNGIPMEMSKTAIAEMILDWEAMSRNFGGNPRTWFETAKKSIPMHPKTEAVVTRALGILYTEDMNLKEFRNPILG